VSDRPYYSGVIEGFYGRPWRHEQRLALLPRLAAWGFAAYIYAPKDDIKLRAAWRERYDATEVTQLTELARACRAQGLRFGYAIAPGLDVRYAEEAELERLRAKVDQVLDLGADDVVLLFDDIPHALDALSRERFGSVAAAQAHLAEGLFAHLRARAPAGRRIVCPTDYCRRMADASGDGWAYLHALGATSSGPATRSSASASTPPRWPTSAPPCGVRLSSGTTCTPTITTCGGSTWGR